MSLIMAVMRLDVLWERCGVELLDDLTGVKYDLFEFFEGGLEKGLLKLN